MILRHLVVKDLRKRIWRLSSVARKPPSAVHPSCKHSYTTRDLSPTPALVSAYIFAFLSTYPPLLSIPLANSTIITSGRKYFIMHPCLYVLALYIVVPFPSLLFSSSSQHHPRRIPVLLGRLQDPPFPPLWPIITRWRQYCVWTKSRDKVRQTDR